MKRILTRHKSPLVVGILLFFGLLFAVESIGNHLCFRTYGLDLGVYTKTLYDHAHLNGNDGTFFLWEPSNQMGGHFDLYLWIFSPLVYLFGNYTLLLVQIAAVLLGMLGMYRLSGLYAKKSWLPLTAMLLVGLSFGVWHALGYDYHSNVVSAMLLPWLLYFVKRCQRVGTVLTAVAMSIAVEASALWTAFVLLALVWDMRRDRPMRRLLMLTSAGCLAYFLVVTLWVMPLLGGGGGTGFWRYKWMGANVGEVARWVVAHPFVAVKDVFVNFTDGPGGLLKREFFLCLLASGLLFTCFKPNYLVMLIPPLALKMLSSDVESFWGVANHYNIELCMVAAVGTVAALGRMRQGRAQTLLCVLAVALTTCTFFYTIGRPQTPIRKANVRILDACHYRQDDFDAATARRLLKQVPADASVCATTMFTPHLAARDSVYIFPMGLAYGAGYYLLLKHHWCYYEGEEDQVDKIINDTVGYRVVDTDGMVYLLEAKNLVKR